MRGIAAYQQRRVESASPTKVVVMLYQEAVHRLTRAAADIEAGGSSHLGDIHHARKIFVELLSALDPNAAPELCAKLASLYQWCLDELVQAGKTKDVKHLNNVVQVANTLLEGWQFVANNGQQAQP